MTIPKSAYVMVTFTLVSLLLLSSFIVFSDSVSGVVNDSDLLQYEWPQIHGDSGFTRFSEGPAPESSNIMWKSLSEKSLDK